MPKIHSSNSIQIVAPLVSVYEKISDFQKWPEWSPWLCLEPETKLTFSEDGQSYVWEGEIIGAGIVRKVSETYPTQLICELTILKPWKFASEVIFQLAEKEGGTELTWIMNGKLPFVMFWMTGMMKTLVGMDYDRGLTMLKDVCEIGSVPSRVQPLGEENYPGCSYVGITTECRVEDIGSCMEKDFSQLVPWAIENSCGYEMPLIARYQTWDIKKATTRYTVGFPMDVIPETLPEGFIAGEIPPTNMQVIEHTGPYRHLGNAWTLGMMLSRQKTFKQKRGLFPFEMYLNSPRNTPENDLVTRVCFPVV